MDKGRQDPSYPTYSNERASLTWPSAKIDQNIRDKNVKSVMTTMKPKSIMIIIASMMLLPHTIQCNYSMRMSITSYRQELGRKSTVTTPYRPTYGKYRIKDQMTYWANEHV